MSIIEELKAAAERAEERRDETKAVAKNAEEARREAFRAYNDALLDQAGVALNKTIVIGEPRWGGSWGAKPVAMVITTGSPHILGKAVGYEVTKANKRWKGRSAVGVSIDKLELTDRELKDV